LRNVSKAADIVAQIPLLSSIAAPVSWFTDIAASVANVFGWSNPLDLSEVTRAVQTIIPYANNVDMPDAAMPLSLYARNAIEVLPGLGGTDIDEMSIDHLKTIFSYWQGFNISTSNTVGQLVHSMLTAPTSFGNGFNEDGRDVYGQSPLTFLTNFFEFYRGGLIFKFIFVSTEFHSGRYAICFVPSESSSPTYGTYANSNYVHREIVDLREGNEFTYHVPYTSISNYRTVSQGFGRVEFYCINPLVAPSSVSSTIRVLVEVCAAPDFEFAALKSTNMIVATVNSPQSKVSFPNKINEISNGSIGSSTLNDDNCMNSRHCIGEKVVSILAMLKHNSQIIPVAQGTTAASAVVSPFLLFVGGYYAERIDSAYRSDLYTMLVSCFSMSRGSVRWRIFNNTRETTNTYETTSSSIVYPASGTIAGIPESTASSPPTNWPLRVVQNSIYRGAIDIQTPPYHHTFARTNMNEFVGNGAIFIKNYADLSANKITINVNTATDTGNIYFRQVADDFQLSGFISTPALIYNP
jgi:hypothetical protein